MAKKNTQAGVPHYLGSIHGVPWPYMESAMKAGKTPKDKTYSVNLITMLADRELSGDQIMENILNDTIPKVVEPIKKKGGKHDRESHKN